MSVDEQMVVVILNEPNMHDNFEWNLSEQR